MNIIRRALKSVTRVYSKTLILFIVTTVLALGIILSFLIRSGINETKSKMSKNLNLGVILNVMGDDKVNQKSKELYDKLGKSPYIDYYDYTASLNSGRVKDAKSVEVKDLNETSKDIYTIKGIKNENILPIRSNRAKLSDGRLFTKEEIKKGSNVTIISKSFAELNGYKVGDKIKTSVAQSQDAVQYGENITMTQYNPNDSANTTFVDAGELEIVGIIDLDDAKIPLNEQFTKGDKALIAEQKAMEYNSIYVPISIVDQMSAKAVEHLPETSPIRQMGLLTMSQPIFIAKDAASLKSFVAEATSEIDKLKANAGEAMFYSEITSDVKTVDNANDSIKAIDNLTNIIFYTLIILSVIVLALVITLFLRDRSYEFGIYMALGQNKLSSLLQLLVETLLIGLCAFTFALALSSVFKDNISDAIISSSTKIEEKQDDMQNYQPSVSDFFPDTGASVDKNYIVDNYAIKLDANSVLIIYLIAIVTLTSATIVPMSYVLNLNPKKILM